MIFLTEPIETSAQYLLNDSRQLTSPQRSIFFAIKGPHHDGHQFIEALYRKGVRQFVIETKACNDSLIKELSKMKDCSIWQVENSILALQNVALNHRKKYNIPVIGITGSNGKTIVKEWLSTLLANKFKIVKSPKSYNSQIGVPLSVWQMNDSHTLGIFEAGISRPDEMENLEKVIKPTLGIFTNIGSAHNEFFPNSVAKIREKAKLFANSDALIYCADYVEMDEFIKQEFIHENQRCKLLDWSRVLSSGIRVDWQIEEDGTSIQVIGDKELGTEVWESERYKTHFKDEASLENITHCIISMLHLGYDFYEIQSRLHSLRPVSMRLELKEGINDCYLIDDTYNNDLAGLTIALNFLGQQTQRQKKVLILSDLLETGITERNLYQQISQLIVEKNIEQVIGIGEVISRNKDLFPNALFFRNTPEFLESREISQFHNALILIKGARRFGFEQIVHKLVQKTHGTVLEINLDAMTNNLNYYRDKIGQDTKIMVMVKAFAYGSGSLEVANLLQFHGVDYLAVAYADEGIHLRQNGIYIPIMVMNPSPADFEKIVTNNLEPEIYSLRILKAFSEFIDHQNRVAKIHIKLDTGMHRLGFEKKDIPELIETLRSNPNIWISTIFSHLVGADEEQFDDFTRSQIKLFNEMADPISAGIGYSPTRHLANSAGIARFPEARQDMVRLGIGLYGVAVTPHDQINLQTVGTLKTFISQIKTIPVGETVGYGRRGKVERETKIATIAIGYADGFDRGFSRGVGEVLVNGVRCPVIGNICMDMTMIDITETQAQEGDEVIIFGKDLTIMELAEKIQTISYEILTNVSGRVKRVFYQI